MLTSMCVRISVSMCVCVCVYVCVCGGGAGSSVCELVVVVVCTRVGVRVCRLLYILAADRSLMRTGRDRKSPDLHLGNLPVRSFSSSSRPTPPAPLKVEHLGSPRSMRSSCFILKDANSLTDCSVLHARRGLTAQCFMRKIPSAYAPKRDETAA